MVASGRAVRGSLLCCLELRPEPAEEALCRAGGASSRVTAAPGIAQGARRLGLLGLRVFQLFLQIPDLTLRRLACLVRLGDSPRRIVERGGGIPGHLCRIAHVLLRRLHVAPPPCRGSVLALPRSGRIGAPPPHSGRIGPAAAPRPHPCPAAAPRPRPRAPPPKARPRAAPRLRPHARACPAPPALPAPPGDPATHRRPAAESAARACREPPRHRLRRRRQNRRRQGRQSAGRSGPPRPHQGRQAPLRAWPRLHARLGR